MPASIPSPPFRSLDLGPLTIHVYGLCYIAALLAAIAITRRRWRRVGGDPAVVAEVALVAFVAGLLGGRLYYLATSWERVPDAWWGPLAVWRGGMGLVGGVALGTMVGAWALRRRGVDVARFMDAAVPGLLAAQAIGRLGNYFNQELFGRPSELPWAVRIDAVDRPPGYQGFATFHPVFLYEALFDLALAAGLAWLGLRRELRPPSLFALYVTGYGLGRLGIELLRIDPAHHLLGMRLNFWMALLLVLAGTAWFAWRQRPAERSPAGLVHP